MLLRSAPSRQTDNKPLSNYTDEYFPYSIDKQQFNSSVTRIFLTRDRDTNEQICLKVWQTSKDDFNLYRANSLELRNRYVYEGLHRNRYFVKDVYMGIAPIVVNEEEIRQKRVVQLGQLIKDPDEKDLKSDVEYALVMKYLEEDWRLDYQLSKGGLNTQYGMKFLAQEIAKIHKKQAKNFTKDQGTPDHILEKLNLNLRILEKLLQLPDAKKLARQQDYRDMMELMQFAGEKYKGNFEQRQGDRHVRHCHGDLKTANLWVQLVGDPQTHGFREPPCLYVLDCVDFNRPEFCYIDTLSDVAMLAIDIQMYVTDWSDPEKGKGKDLVHLFLETYLQEMKERRVVAWPLLEYYLIEKAIVFACLSVLYDNLPMSVAEKYLDIGLLYMQKLKRRLPSPGKLPSNKRELSAAAAGHHST
jgi:aminoglycoside phosphotransferase family enzyme